MSILISKDTKVITQGITGKTGQFHTRMCREYANGKNCFVAGVNPKKAGEDFEGIPIYASVGEAAAASGATVSVIYVPPAGAAAAIWEAVEADLDLVVFFYVGLSGFGIGQIPAAQSLGQLLDTYVVEGGESFNLDLRTQFGYCLAHLYHLIVAGTRAQFVCLGQQQHHRQLAV